MSRPDMFCLRAARVAYYAFLFLTFVCILRRLLMRFKQKLEKARELVPVTGEYTLGGHQALITDFIWKSDDLLWSFCSQIWGLVITPMLALTIYVDFNVNCHFPVVYLLVFLIGAFLLALIRYFQKPEQTLYVCSYGEKYKEILANGDSNTLPAFPYLQYKCPAGGGEGSAKPTDLINFMKPGRPIVLSEDTSTTRQLLELLNNISTDYTSQTEVINDFISLFYSS